jgi:hypothetical protein
MVKKLVRIGNEILESANHGGYRVLVEPQEQRRRRRRCQYFVEEQIERRVRRYLKSIRRLPHFPDPVSDLSNMLRAVERMKAESHLQLVDRFACNARHEDLVQPLKRPVHSLQTRNRLADGQASRCRLIHRKQAHQGWQTGEAFVGIQRRIPWVFRILPFMNDVVWRGYVHRHHLQHIYGQFR